MNIDNKKIKKNYSKTIYKKKETKMEKTITSRFGKKIEVETEGNFCGIRSGDVVTRDKKSSSSCCWRNKRVLVKGFKNISLWGTVEGEKKSLYTLNPKGLILLKRQGLEFEVGDKVKATNGKAEKKEGKIIVIDPYEYMNIQLLIKFKNFIDGHDARDFWEKLWYPNQYKTSSKSCYWLSEKNLQFLNKKE